MVEKKGGRFSSTSISLACWEKPHYIRYLLKNILKKVRRIEDMVIKRSGKLKLIF
jgi:hypothetical protein